MKTKPAVKSTGVQGAVVSILAGVAILLQLDYGEAQIGEWVAAGAAFIGGLWALWGRLTATEEIDRIV
jgi:hypothetical protein